MVKKLYREEWNKFKTNYKNIFIGMLITLILCGSISYFVAVSNPTQTKKLMNFVVEMLMEKGFGEMMEGETPSENGKATLSTETKNKMFFMIFKNNLMAVTMIVMAGLFSYIIFPYIYGYLSIIINSTLIGIVLAYESIMGGSAFKTLIFSIMPHGLTEFTAILLAATLCIFTGNQLFKSLFKLITSDGKKKQGVDLEENEEGVFEPKKQHSYISEVLNTFKKVGITYITVIVPLIFISAIIESYATIHIMNWFL